MICNWKVAALAGALAVVGAAPASAYIISLPIIGDIEHPDMDPFHVMSPPPPAAAPAAAPAAMPMKHHKKMMKHKMKKKKM